MYKVIIAIISILILFLGTSANDFLMNQFALLLQIKPQHAAHKIKMGVWVILLATLLVWTITLTVRSLKNRKH